MKNKFFRSKLFSVGMIIFLMLFISACSNKPGTIGEFIYTAGWYTDASGTIACYWKNGVKTDLTNTSSIAYARASAIFVSGSDVYVAGYYIDSGVYHACYWKNGGTPIPLAVVPAPDSVTVTSIYVSGTDVYVAGYYTNGTGSSSISVACYWNNSTGTMTKTDLTDTSLSTYARASGIYVSGSIVYVAGWYTDADDNIIACYWNDGTGTMTKTDLTDPSLITYAWASGIYVSGSVVYVAGSYTNSPGSVVACYWNNGTGTMTETDLTVSPAPVSVPATSIYVSNSVVYVADTYINSGVYAAMWQNGAITTLTELIAPAGVTATSIYMIASDVYVGGSYINGAGSIACYWKNGVIAALPAVAGYTAAEVESIFVTTL
jgi:hypothetical protein